AKIPVFFFQNETYRVGDVAFDIHAKNRRTDSARYFACAGPHCLWPRNWNVDGRQDQTPIPAGRGRCLGIDWRARRGSFSGKACRRTDQSAHLRARKPRSLALNPRGFRLSLGSRHLLGLLWRRSARRTPILFYSAANAAAAATILDSG